MRVKRILFESAPRYLPRERQESQTMLASILLVAADTGHGCTKHLPDCVLDEPAATRYARVASLARAGASMRSL